MLAVVLASVLAGVVLTLVAQCLWLRRRFRSLPTLPVPLKSQTDTFRLPKEFVKLLNDPELRNKKETCLFLNVLFQFLFRELKDTQLVRRWVIRKMNAEFVELLQTTSGKLLDRISVRDFNFGATFPVVHNAAIKHLQTSEDDQCLEELDIALDVDYQGGFHLAVDADLVFGKSAYLSVKVMELKGCLRLQLTRHPYTHWSLAFYEEPSMEFNVESRFEGRPIPQITSLIVNQIRRSIRKKHTLPNYKMRFKPFFLPQEAPVPSRDLFFHGNRIGHGCLEVSVIECSRLLTPPTDSFLYCTISVGCLPWGELMRIRKTFVLHDVEIVRSAGQPIGMLFKEDFLLERYESVIVIEAISADGPAALVDVKKNDILVAVGGQKVTSQKQAAKLLKNAGERFSIRLERAVLNKSGDMGDIRFEEDVISVKDGEQRSREDSSADKSEEDFVHISVKSVNGDMRPLLSQTSSQSEKSPQKRSPMAALLRRRTRSSAGDIQTSESPQSSPEVRRRTVTTATATEAREVSKDSPPRSPFTSPKKQSLPKSEKVTLPSDVQSSPERRKYSAERLEEPCQPDIDEDSDPELDDETENRRTSLVAACQDPIWNEKFRFDVEEGQKYLNVCVWCKIPEKMDRNDKLVKAEKDLLLGHVSLTLNDIALDCLMTLQGDTQRTVHLSPVETKAGASRAKLPNLGAHPGFNPNLCFGDITLGFLHTPLKSTLEERKKLTKHPTTLAFPFEEDPVQAATGSGAAERVDEGLHVFISAQFHAVTYCHFCGKKIWLKTAFQCHSCDMICHKKCTEKCQAQTLCRKDGVRRRSQPDVSYTTPMTPAETDKKKAADENVAPKPGGILSKFRKDSAGKKGKSLSSSPQAARKMMSGNQIRPERSPFFIRRRNSAPDDNEGDGNPSGGDFLTVRQIPRTRSTTSLQCLVDQNASPAIANEEFNKNGDKSGESSGDEGGVTMSQSAVIEAIRPSGHGHNVDEMVVMAAKQMGRELFSHLSLAERKGKLDAMVSKLQQEIDLESEHRAELGKAEEEMLDSGQRKVLQVKIVKADEKIQALMVLMLHYCAGLQHCMDMEEVRRQENGQEPAAASPPTGDYSHGHAAASPPKGDYSHGHVRVDHPEEPKSSSSKDTIPNVRVCESTNNDTDSTSEAESSYELELERNSLMSA